MPAIAYPHIEFNANGLAIISGTTMKVVELIGEHLAWKWDAPQLQLQHPYLSLAQIYAALTYFHDHEAELRQEIQRREEQADAFFARIESSPLHEKLSRAKRGA